METVEESIRRQLRENGLPSEGAEQVVGLAKANEAINALVDWDTSTDEYPPDTLFQVWRIIRGIALGWVDANSPEAWYRSRFVN